MADNDIPVLEHAAIRAEARRELLFTGQAVETFVNERKLDRRWIPELNAMQAIPFIGQTTIIGLWPRTDERAEKPCALTFVDASNLRPYSVSKNRIWGESGLSSLDFVKLIMVRSRLAPEVLTIASYFLHRTRHEIKRAPLMQQGGKRLLLAALILADMNCNDDNHSSLAWANMTLLDIAEINSLTTDLLQLMNWNINFEYSKDDRDEFRKFKSKLLEASGTSSLFQR